MPIYAYRCATCGHAKDVLRKMSDPPLTECPACGASTFVKQVTAAGFQLKGSGWYVTDFKGGAAALKADKTESSEGADTAKAEKGTSGEPGPAAKTEAKSDARAGSTAESASSKGQAAPASAAPAAAPAAPTPPATGSK